MVLVYLPTWLGHVYGVNLLVCIFQHHGAYGIFWSNHLGIIKKNHPVMEFMIWLVVSTYPSEKYEFVSWDYDIPNKYMEWNINKTQDMQDAEVTMSWCRNCSEEFSSSPIRWFLRVFLEPSSTESMAREIVVSIPPCKSFDCHQFQATPRIWRLDRKNVPTFDGSEKCSSSFKDQL